MNSPLDRLADMAVFAQVVEAGSFSDAARQLGLTPSAVSRQVARLEAALRVRLLERTTRQLRLTDAGSAALANCQTLVAAAREVMALSDTQSATPRGLVRISMPKAWGRQMVHPWMPAFLARYPEVDVQLIITDRTVDLLGESIDLAIRITEAPPPGLAGRPLMVVRHLLCASPTYLAARACQRIRVSWPTTAVCTWVKTSATAIGGFKNRASRRRCASVADMWPTTARFVWRVPCTTWALRACRSSRPARPWLRVT